MHLIFQAGTFPPAQEGARHALRHRRRGELRGQAEHDRVIRSFLPVWTGALRDESGATFARVAVPHVRLEGSIFATLIDGRENVWTSLRTAAGITDTLSFTHESAAPDRSYLEWELEALGQRFQGVTVLRDGPTTRRLSRRGCLLPSPQANQLR